MGPARGGDRARGRRHHGAARDSGFSRLLPSIVVVVTYAVWAGAGTALIVIVGALAFGEALGALKLAGVRS